MPADTDAPAEVFVGRAIARTGADGEELLGHLAAQGDEAAMRAFLASDDAATMQRTTVRAYADDPEVTEGTWRLHCSGTMRGIETTKQVVRESLAGSTIDNFRLLRYDVCKRGRVGPR